MEISVALEKRDREELLGCREEAGVPAGPVNSVEEVFADPQIISRGMKIQLSAHYWCMPGVSLWRLFAKPLRRRTSKMTGSSRRFKAATTPTTVNTSVILFGVSRSAGPRSKWFARHARPALYCVDIHFVAEIFVPRRFSRELLHVRRRFGEKEAHEACWDFPYELSFAADRRLGAHSSCARVDQKIAPTNCKS